MRLRRRGIGSAIETVESGSARAAAWDGLLRATGPVAVIRAVRAGETTDQAEVLQVA